MKKKDLENLRILKNEIRLLQDDIDHPVIVSDSVVGSMTVHPYIERTIVVTGIDVERDDRLRKLLLKRVADLQDELLVMEQWMERIEDSEMRQILRLRYRDGKSWQQVAFAIGESDESYPRRKANKFLKHAENAEM